MLHVIYHLIFFVTINFFLCFGQSSEASQWRVFYQRGLPRLVNYQARESILSSPVHKQFVSPVTLGTWLTLVSLKSVLKS